MSSINYSEKIPNNVNLSEDRTLARALEQWQPNYLSWWNDMGPDGSQNFDVYLRTAISVDPQGWAQFGHVKMPDYRWGIFLTPPEKERLVPFGWQGEPPLRDIREEARRPFLSGRVPFAKECRQLDETDSELAQRVGVSEATVKGWENGARAPKARARGRGPRRGGRRRGRPPGGHRSRRGRGRAAWERPWPRPGGRR